MIEIVVLLNTVSRLQHLTCGGHSCFCKIVYRDRLPFPRREVVKTLEILKWECLLHDVATGEFTPELEDAGSDGWLSYLGVDCLV